MICKKEAREGAFKLTFALITVLSLVPALGAQQGSGQNNAQNSGQQFAQQAQQQKPSAAQTQQAPVAEEPKADPAEEAAYKSFVQIDAQNTDQQIQAGEQFIEKYPSSRYVQGIYSRLTQAYYSKQQFDKMYVAGDKALALNGDDISVLVLVGWVMPHSYNPNDLEAEKKLDKAGRYCKHGLELLGSLQRPEGMSDEAFAAAKSEAADHGHSGLGLVYFRQNKFAESVAELQQAIKATNNPDPTNYYVMGIDQQQLKQYGDAADSFTKCASSPSGLQAACKQKAEQAKQQASQAAPSKP